jgi:phospholipase D1/2
MSHMKINVNPQASRKRVFLPGEKIQVEVRAERKQSAYLFHPYIYTLTFTHGNAKWSVNRSYKDIKDTHKTLAKFVKNETGRSCSDISGEEAKPDWPLFPVEHDFLVFPSELVERCDKIGEYLRRVLTYPPFRDHPSVLGLLGVSHVTFVIGLAASFIEDLFQKRTGDNFYYGHFRKVKSTYNQVKKFDKRWFALKDTYLVYLNPKNNYELGFVMLFDKLFQCEMKIKPGAYNTIEVKNSQLSYVLKCKSSRQQREWYDKIHAALSSTGRMFYDECFLSNGSFAPSRVSQMARWYVNASVYMEHVMLALNNAREEIFITDWWLSPELFLKRPTIDLQYRLDKILVKKASEGVKIYILLFKELTLAVNLLSSRAKKVLCQNGKIENIKVLRHCSDALLWSHHEKCVIIDQSVAFMGGIDLCFGRWDDDLHRLVF